MGTVITFPAVGQDVRGPSLAADRSQSATVIILPVIRIERYVEDPSGEPEASSTPRRRRRRRATRS